MQETMGSHHSAWGMVQDLGACLSDEQESERQATRSSAEVVEEDHEDSDLGLAA